MTVPISRSISGIKVPNVDFSWEHDPDIEGRICINLNDLERSKFCNSKYSQLEGELTELCNRPSFSTLGMKPTQRQALQRNRPENIFLSPLGYSSPFEACEKSALVSMVKDEGDVIFYNLCWHYFMGFRKFIIIDNGSTDNTSSEIIRFKNLSSSSARVIQINDTRVLYAQASRMNAISKLAEIIFPEIDWIFPNDADEFIVFDESIQERMRKVPSNINCVHSPRITYIPADDYFAMPADRMFYEKLHVAHKRNPYNYPDDGPWNGKSFFRAHHGIFIVKGNHFASDASSAAPTYISGLELGIHIREYPLRSPEHALRKIANMGKAHIALREKYTQLYDIHYADHRYARYLEIGDEAGREEFSNFMKTGGCSFDEKMPIDACLEYASKSAEIQEASQNFNFLPKLDISFIFYQELFAEAEASKELIKIGNKFGLQSRTRYDFAEKASKHHLDICLTGAPWDKPFKSNPSRYSYLYSHVNTAAMCQHLNPAQKKYKFFLQVGKNCSVPNASLYGRKKGFYFSKGLTDFEHSNMAESSIFFCGGARDARYGKVLSTLDEQPFFNWYGSSALSSKKSYKGYVRSVINAIKKHRVALTLHSKHHLENSEPSARIFEAAAAGAVIISDRHPFVLENFADSVLYINQADSEEKIAEDILKHYRWIKNNPEDAITMAERSHQIFVDRFTKEDQLLKIAQLHQEAIILDDGFPLPPRLEFSYVYDRLSMKKLNQLLKTTKFQSFKIQNSTDRSLNDLLQFSLIKRVKPEGEIINAPSGMFFVGNDGQRSATFSIAPSDRQQIAHVNLEMRHEDNIAAGSSKILDLLGQNIYLTGLADKPCISSYEVNWQLNSFSVILR